MSYFATARGALGDLVFEGWKGPSTLQDHPLCDDLAPGRDDRTWDEAKS
jgi:hypothetical protein